ITLFKTGKDGTLHYYTVHDRQQVLDAPYAICASWRAGLGREREKLHRYERLADRDAAIRKLIAKRIKDGYRLLYTFSRSGFSTMGLFSENGQVTDERSSAAAPIKAGEL
ncbi:MAG: hypothetical protein Q8M76_07670, partial [Spirochaetaceae bacterium]|nr:hypothetical protein [Spirochaetaceae bacterium]